MNKRLLAVPVIIVAALAAWWLTRDHAQAGDSLVLHGNVDIRQVDLAFNASGRVDSIAVQEGDRVTRGQVLARLDTVRLQLALTQAQATAAAQRSQVAKLRAGSRPEEIAQAAAQRDAAKAAAEDAKAVYERQLELVNRHFVSRQQADSAKHGYDAAAERLKAAEETYQLAVMGPRREDVNAAEAGLAALEAAVATLKHDIAEGELKSPADGVVENRILEPGDMASPSKAVLTLALTDPVWVRVYLPESALGRVPLGAQAEVTTDSHPDQRYVAWIGNVSPTAEFTPKTVETPELRTSLLYQTRVFVCDPKGELRQGMPATVSIKFDQAAPAQPTTESRCPPAR